MRLSRRLVLCSLGSALTVQAAGCPSADEPTDTARETASPAPTPSATETRSPRSTTSSPTPDLSAADVLPEPPDGWQLNERDGLSWRMLGGESGRIGRYTSPDGVRFEVVVLEMSAGFSADDKATRWACIGWDVGVSYEGFAFAAGTGTKQQTYTPETPPHMTRTPVPGTENESRELLASSPLLTEEIVTEYAVTCDR